MAFCILCMLKLYILPTTDNIYPYKYLESYRYIYIFQSQENIFIQK